MQNRRLWLVLFAGRWIFLIRVVARLSKQFAFWCVKTNYIYRRPQIHTHKHITHIHTLKHEHSHALTRPMRIRRTILCHRLRFEIGNSRKQLDVLIYAENGQGAPFPVVQQHQSKKEYTGYAPANTHSAGKTATPKIVAGQCRRVWILRVNTPSAEFRGSTSLDMVSIRMCACVCVCVCVYVLWATPKFDCVHVL